MALQIRSLAQPDCGDVSLRTEAAAAAALPGLRDAGRGDGHEVSPVWREHDIFLRRGEQVSRPLDAANFPSDLFDPGNLLRNVCAVVCHHDETFGGPGSRRWVDGAGWNCHSGQLPFGRFASTGL